MTREDAEILVRLKPALEHVCVEIRRAKTSHPRGLDDIEAHAIVLRCLDYLSPMLHREITDAPD